MKKLIFFSIWWCSAGMVALQSQTLTANHGLIEAIRIYGEPVLSANPDLLGSTSNDVGPWGSPDFLYSLTNDFGPLGSPEMLKSVTNEYGTGVQIRLLDTTLEGPLELEAP